jgi:hypothetical protein
MAVSPNSFIIFLKLSKDIKGFLLINPAPVGQRGHFILQKLAGSTMIVRGSPRTFGSLKNLDILISKRLNIFLGLGRTYLTK